MPPIHPDLTAYRAVDACGGVYSTEDEASGYANGHRDALIAAEAAVAKPDALMAEMLEALKAAQTMVDVALPQFNWAKSPLSGEAIRLLNEAPMAVRDAIAKAEGRS